MLFTEAIFLPFFLIVFALFWTIPDNDLRKSWLLLCSYAFYGWWDWRFLGLILLSTSIDYHLGGSIASAVGRSRRKRLVTLSVVANLGVLACFKYLNFFIDSANQLLGILGAPPIGGVLGIALPVGISFFTFQSMSYTIDIYRGKCAPAAGFRDFALFVSFFPQLVAGPIVRAKDFLPQLDAKTLFGNVRFRTFFTLFLIGFIKKAIVGDSIATVVDPVFAAPDDHGCLDLCLCSILYCAQIYCDFSGYTDMAIACAGLLGFTLPLNFRFPYFSASITDFWRRWHISLSSWLRDYLYIPLGGNRGGQKAMYRNILITMLLGGLWHGASWTFVVWGAAHGIALVIHKMWQGAEGDSVGRAMSLLGVPITFMFVALTFVVFRSPDFSGSVDYFYGIMQIRESSGAGLNPWLWGVAIALGAAHWIAYRYESRAAKTFNSAPGWLFAFFWGAIFALTLFFKPIDSSPFIYFQF